MPKIDGRDDTLDGEIIQQICKVFKKCDRLLLKSIKRIYSIVGTTEMKIDENEIEIIYIIIANRDNSSIQKKIDDFFGQNIARCEQSYVKNEVEISTTLVGGIRELRYGVRTDENGKQYYVEERFDKISLTRERYELHIKQDKILLVKTRCSRNYEIESDINVEFV